MKKIMSIMLVVLFCFLKGTGDGSLSPTHLT